MNTRNSELLGKYDVKKLLIKLSVPAMMGMMVNALYNLVDTLFVARGVNELAIGALSYAFPIQMILMAIGLMIGIGSASVFSRAFGAKDHEKMVSVVNTALRIDTISAIVLSIAGFVFLDTLLDFFGASASNIGYAKDYLSIIFIGLTPLSLSMVLNNLTRAEGRVKIAMVSMMIGAGLNIILDPIFIFDQLQIFGVTIPLFGLGVQGAAIATVISQVVAFTYIFKKAFSHESALKISFDNFFKIDFVALKEIIVIGFPTFLRNSLGALLSILIFKMIEYYAVGDPAIYVSIYGVINRITIFVFMPGFGIVQGLSPIVGFNFGAKQYKRIRDVVIFSTKIVVTYFALGFVFVQIFAKYIFQTFSDTNDSFFIDYGSETFKIISIGFILVGFQIIVGALYQALGYPIRALLISVSRQFLIFIPVAFVLSYFMGLQGIWYTFAVSDILAGLLGVGFLIYEMIVLNKLIRNEKSSSILE